MSESSTRRALGIGPSSAARLSWPAVLATGWVILYYVVVLVLTRPFPVSDDFALLQFLNRLHQSPGAWGSLLVEQYNDHRIVATRLVFGLYDLLFGSLNLRVIALLGCLSVLGMFRLLWRHRTDQHVELQSRVPLYALTIVLVVFSMAPAENMLFAMAAVTNNLIVLLAMATMHWLLRGDRRAYGFATVAAVVAIYTLAHGVLVGLVGVVLLAAHGQRLRSALLLVTTAAAFGVFLVGYQINVAAPVSVWSTAWRSIIVALSIIGAMVGVGGTSVPSLAAVTLPLTVILGTGIVVLTLGALRHARHDSHAAFYAWTNLWIIGSALLIGYGRHSFGLSQGLVSRYRIYSLIAVAGSLLLVRHLRRLGLLRVRDRGEGLIAGLVILAAIASLAFPAYFYLVTFAPAGRGEYVHPDPATAAQIYEESVRLGVISGGAGRQVQSEQPRQALPDYRQFVPDVLRPVGVAGIGCQFLSGVTQDDRQGLLILAKISLGSQYQAGAFALDNGSAGPAQPSQHIPQPGTAVGRWQSGPDSFNGVFGVDVTAPHSQEHQQGALGFAGGNTQDTIRTDDPQPTEDTHQGSSPDSIGHGGSWLRQEIRRQGRVC